MILEEDPVKFFQWLLPGAGTPGALLGFVLFAFALAVFVAFLCFLFATLRQGPNEAFFTVAKAIRDGIVDLLNTSPRRVIAMARLAVQESLRRRVLIAFAVFVLIILFAGWFLDVKSDHPARLYLSVVLTATQYIVLILALFLSTFSLPNDIKNRTIYTVVTKPVRSIDIVLGRIIGFGTVGTALLILMCLGSYLFLVRGMRHTHRIDAASLVAQTDSEGNKVLVGETSQEIHHRHVVSVDEVGNGQTDRVMDHHHVGSLGDNEGEYELSMAQGMLEARVPVYGQLRFLDRFGRLSQGTNVGNEWGYRKYIEGRTRAAAIWTFEGITEEKFPNGLPLELSVSVFRTHKGEIDQPIPGKIEIRNPNRQADIQRSAPFDFESVEFGTQKVFIGRELDAVDKDGRLMTLVEPDLFRDFVDDGKLEVWVFCNEPQQFFGMARADLYLRAADKSFFVNFIKCHLSIWFQMIIVISFGVMFSTLLNGPVAMLSTMACIIIGLNSHFMHDVALGIELGGGPVESFYRIITQNNVMVDLEKGPGTSTIKGVDFVLNFITLRVSWLLPNFRDFNTSEWVAGGFDISADLVWMQATITLAFFCVLSIIGYFLLKTREIAA